MMCTHCQGLFSPHSWERHLELGCPQEPAEQVVGGAVEMLGEQSLQCGNCDRTFKRKDHLKRH